MAITFSCQCGRTLKARDELAGRRAKCPQCGTILEIPEPEVAPSAPAFDDDGGAYGLQDPDPAPGPSPSHYEDEEADSPAPSRSPSRPRARARDPFARDDGGFEDDGSAGGSSLLEYTYLLLVFALVPLVFSLLAKDEMLDIQQRIEQSVKNAPPEDQKRIAELLSNDSVDAEALIGALPGRRLHGAHLARDTSVHWVYAAIAATGFLLFLTLFFSVERANPGHLLGVGAFTGTVGIVFLLLVQFCSHIRFGRIRGRGIVILILLFLAFIGWSYGSANDPGSNFLLSALGFTFGVGLCEEFTKAIPLFAYYNRDSSMGWRGACLWGLASGIGFGVSEGIMYSSRYYNGLSGVDIYLVRFVSCVALHAMWSASVGIAIARNVHEYERASELWDYVLFTLRVLGVPMVLHGFYDTLLKKDMNGWALVVALLSFAWLAWHIELARSSSPGAGRLKLARS